MMTGEWGDRASWVVASAFLHLPKWFWICLGDLPSGMPRRPGFPLKKPAPLSSCRIVSMDSTDGEDELLILSQYVLYFLA